MVTKVGSNGSEYLYGTDFSDTLYGLGGNDTMDGWNGNDIMYGGEGDDWVYGGRNNDMLYGGAGNDRLYGQEDTDTLVGAYDGAGDDTLDGGSGYDTADYGAATKSVFVNLDKGTASGSEVGQDKLYGIENVNGGESNDILIGDNGGAFGIGGLGENVLDGRGGNDTLYGRAGNDTLLGGAGNDVLKGEDGNDKLYGGEDWDFLIGGVGDDTLYGEGGDDYLYGGAGNDTFNGGAGVDTVSYADAASGLQMYRQDGYAWGGAEGTDQFYNVENLEGSNYDDVLTGDFLGHDAPHRLDGGGGNDYIYGASGNDSLIGGTGDDVLRGNNGVDLLTGGAGSDYFEFWSIEPGLLTGVGQGNRDYITDFQPGADKMTFQSPSWLDPAEANYGVDRFTFIGQADFTAVGQIGVSYYGSDTIVRGNTDPDSAADFEIQLNGHLTLSANDFVFYY